MTTLINKIELLIKREKTTPEKQKKDDSNKTSNEILSELFGVFNADPPKIEEGSLKRSKKSKRKHKKEKKKRSRSDSIDSNDSDYSHKHKKRKKSKTKSKRRRNNRSSTPSESWTPPRNEPDVQDIKLETDCIKKEHVIVKTENNANVGLTFNEIKQEENIWNETKNFVDTSLIPMPEPLDNSDLRFKLESKKQEIAASDSDKAKGKIQIKNLKFSAVFEETVKQVEEEARKKAEKYEDGEYTDSSSASDKEEASNSQFPKSSDPGGILKKQAAEEKMIEDDKNYSKRSKHSESSRKTSRKKSRDRSRKRSQSKSRRSRSRSASRRRHYKKSRDHRSRSRRRSTSRSKARVARHHSPRHRARRSRSATGVRLADSEKKRLLEVARRNAINMLRNGAVPAGAAALPPHTRSQVMAAIHSGGKSVDELTDFCKHLSKKEALGELSSVSEDDDMSENEDTLAFHHPFLVKEKAPIVMNIRGGAPLPVKTTTLSIASKDELRMQFPVSSGSQHREKAIEWVPVTPQQKESNMQVAKLNQKYNKNTTIPAICDKPAVPVVTVQPDTPAYSSKFSTGNQVTPVLALPAPGPQAYPPGINASKTDIGSLVSEKLLAIRKEQEQYEMPGVRGFGWSASDSNLGQFMGSTGAHILTPKELASGTQAWAKKDQLTRAAPVEGGMGMHLLQKMGWTPGQGLGKEGTGTLQPLLLEVKLDTRGLQAKEEAGRMKGGRGGGGGGGARRGAGAPPVVAGNKHPVSLLGEYCSKQKLGPPEYTLCFECGPDHKKNFLFKVKVAGVEYQPAVASANKKQAKADSAQLALQKLGILMQ